MTDYGPLGEVCTQQARQQMLKRTGPKLLMNCCEKLFFCRCFTSRCQESGNEQYCSNSCGYDRDGCDDSICDSFTGQSSNCGTSSGNIGLIALIAIDIILTIVIIVVVCVIEMRKRRPGEISAPGGGRIGRSTATTSRLSTTTAASSNKGSTAGGTITSKTEAISGATSPGKVPVSGVKK